MTYRIEKVGVVGAGTMGAGIAAHLANIGIPVVLLDIVTPGLSDAEKDDPQARNRMVQTLYDRMAKARPANLARQDRGDLITIGNIEDDFDKLADCDWIVEVVIERLDIKRQLMARLDAIRKPTAIVSSNTSGIPIAEIVAESSESMKAHFLGTHFFNPPRYLKLLEIIPTGETAQAVVDFMVEFGRNTLGKGVVVCKDSPNFIGNRFFSVAASYGIEYAFENGYSIAEIDAITGPLIGRPKSATFRLMDLVGLDVMGHVNSNLYDAVPDDAYRETLRPAKTSVVMEKLIGNKWLGNKTGQGFYKKETVNGQREFLTLNPDTFEYELAPNVRFASVGATRKIEDLGKRVTKLFEQDDRAATYVRDTLLFGFAYAAYVAPEIAYKLTDVDDAMRWGFAHEAGPFQMWDMLGVRETAAAMEANGLEVADWVKEMLDAGYDCFYENGSYYDWNSKRYKLAEVDKNIILAKNCDEVARNDSASLRDMGDGVLLLEFHSKMNALDTDIIAMGNIGLEKLETEFDAMVVGNNGQDFSVGANLAMVGIAAAQGMWDQVEKMLYAGQKFQMDLRYARKPIVTAPHQRVLGGGVEMTMAGWASVADHETYMGLVEVGVGIIPAWGGCTEMIRRKVNPVMRTDNADVLPPLQSVFEQIATAKVGESAWQNRELGYLRDSDVLAFNSDHRLKLAKDLALGLAEAGVKAPEVEKIYAAGRDLYYALLLGLKSFEWAAYATPHDVTVGKKLAYVLCGGDLSAGTWVDPWHMLDLEREAVMSLAGTEETKARVMHMLQTGRPLRN